MDSFDIDFCLLCLKADSKIGGRIEVNSAEWQEENLETLIKKHLYAKIDFTNADWLCKSCWDALNTFHKFYLRIKESHEILKASRIKDFEDAVDIQNGRSSLVKDRKEYFKDNVETEIWINHPLLVKTVTDYDNPLMKTETDYTENKSLESRRKRGRPPKDTKNEPELKKKDPLKKRNVLKIKKTKRISDSLKIVNKALVSVEDPKLDITKGSADSLDNINVATTELEINDNSNYETDYDVCDDKKSSDSSKKKRKNPDEKTRQEHDKTIAEYFKIFCSICQIPVDNFIALRKHFREEHKKRGFVICCKKKIFTRPILVDHIHFHLDPNLFKCTRCDKVYSDRCTLESHLKIHEDGQQERKHACDVCGKSFVGTTQLETHKLTHAPDYEKFSCGECGKFFTTLYSLNYHVKAIHHNKYVKICDICGKTMRCRNSFKLHMEKHDDKSAVPIHCDICGLRLIDRRGLRRHKNSQHPVGGKKEYSCHICAKISPNPRALRTHVRFAHEAGYVHKCTMCEKAFKRSEALKEHLATHTGTPLYTCPWCPKTFISNGNMHNHRKKTHPKEWEEAQRQKYGGKMIMNNENGTATNVN